MKGIKDHLSEPIEKSLLEFASYDSEAAEKTVEFVFGLTYTKGRIAGREQDDAQS